MEMLGTMSGSVAIEDGAEAPDQLREAQGRQQPERAIEIGDLHEVGADLAHLIAHRRRQHVGHNSAIAVEMPGKGSTQQEPQAFDNAGKRRHGELMRGIKIMCEAVERLAQRMPTLEERLGKRREHGCCLPASARTPQHDGAAKVGERFASEAGVAMDSGELVRGEADVDLVVAGIVSARSRHAEGKHSSVASAPPASCRSEFLLAKTQLALLALGVTNTACGENLFRRVLSGVESQAKNSRRGIRQRIRVRIDSEGKHPLKTGRRCVTRGCLVWADESQLRGMVGSGVEEAGSEEVSASEGAIDDAFLRSELPGADAESARWALCAVGEDLQRWIIVTAARKGVAPTLQERRELGLMLDDYKYALKHSLDMPLPSVPAQW